MTENKTERIFIRVSPTEKKEIEEKAKLTNQSVANYLITLSKNQRIVVAKKMPRFITEINKIGVNINQITATANSTKYVSKEMLLKVSEEREKVIGLLQQILDEVYNIDDHSFQSLENKIDRLTSFQSLENKIDRLTAAVEKLQKSNSQGKLPIQ